MQRNGAPCLEAVCFSERLCRALGTRHSGQIPPCWAFHCYSASRRHSQLAGTPEKSCGVLLRLAKRRSPKGGGWCSILLNQSTYAKGYAFALSWCFVTRNTERSEGILPVAQLTFEPNLEMIFREVLSVAIVRAVKGSRWLFQRYASSPQAASFSEYLLLACSL